MVGNKKTLTNKHLSYTIMYKISSCSSLNNRAGQNKMTKKIVWRLREQPTTQSLRELVKDELLTKEQAQEILFSSETKEDRDKESLKTEIKFLRELVEKLAKRSEIATIIREIPLYKREGWYDGYTTWCSSGTATTSDAGSGIPEVTYTSFSDINTF